MFHTGAKMMTSIVILVLNPCLPVDGPRPIMLAQQITLQIDSSAPLKKQNGQKILSKIVERSSALLLTDAFSGSR